jgi:ADP-heptose:LPS heptosyltransferase
VRWYNLGPTAAAGQTVGGAELVDLPPSFRDFADVAAAIANLDLVISADTVVAHIAGALGKDVWTLLPYSADWRWMEDSSETPWYPTMRLFRQPAPHDWATVAAKVTDALREKVPK